MLELLKKKIIEKREINVSYLGGSITKGSGATAPSFRWSSRIHRWFQETYQNIEWREFNAGIGGTNSEFGIFRLHSDVLVHNPDLVFVEFAVNDYHTKDKQCLNAMEAIVRNIKLSQPEVEIVFIITATVSMYQNDYSKGKIPDSVQFHEKIAEWYHIPVIHVGQALIQKVQEEAMDFSKYLTDGTHPNDAGYALYYKVIREFIESTLAKQEKYNKNYSLPLVIGDGRYLNTHVVPAVELQNIEFFKEEKLLVNKYNGYISAGVPGTKGSIEFEGTGIGVFWGICKDSGILEYQIDDGEVKQASSWDEYALSFDRCNHSMLATGLEPGVHMMKFWVSEKKDEQSIGNFLRIVNFLIM